jgi:hypothetical protein
MPACRTSPYLTQRLPTNAAVDVVSGYFPKRIVLPHLKAKRLNVIGGAPEFSMPAYIAYSIECDRDLFRSALEIRNRCTHRDE